MRFDKWFLMAFASFGVKSAFAISIDRPVEVIQKDYESCSKDAPSTSQKTLGTASRFWISKENTKYLNFKVLESNEHLKFKAFAIDDKNEVSTSGSAAGALEGFFHLGLAKTVTLGTCRKGLMRGSFVESVELVNGIVLSSADLEKGVNIKPELKNGIMMVSFDSISRDLAVKILNRGAHLADYEKILDPNFAMTKENFMSLWGRSKWQQNFMGEGGSMMATKEVISPSHTPKKSGSHE